MPAASFAHTNFTGGEWSQTYQGRFDLPAYKTAMNVSLNGYPMEEGAWTRRPGFNWGGMTRMGTQARIDNYAVQEELPTVLEWTTGYVRFYVNGTLAIVNNSQAATAVSTDNPAVVTVTTAPATGVTVMFTNVVGTMAPYIENRQFLWTNVSGTTGSIADAFTGTNIDGSAIGSFTSGNMVQVYELTTVYAGADFLNLRVVQTDGAALILHGTYAPQVMAIVTEATVTASPTFSLAAANFVDGPYLDPPTNNAVVTPSAKTGIINLVVSFPAYSATTVYTNGQFVTYSGTSYQSLVDQNLDNEPDTSATQWAPVNAAIAIGPNGFQGSDVGRHVRLYSEPNLWSSASVSYTAGTVVKYLNASGDYSYWTCLANHTSSAILAPGISATDWGVNAAGSLWTWGKITGLLNVVPGSPSGIGRKGDMTADGGLAAAFDGVLGKLSTASAGKATMEASVYYESFSAAVTCYVGQDFHSCSPTSYKVQSVTVVPSTDQGFATLYGPTQGGNQMTFWGVCTFNLYASNSAPSNATNGTLIGTASVPIESSKGRVLNNFNPAQAFNPGPVNIASTDQATAYKYIWVEMSFTFNQSTDPAVALGMYVTPFISQMEIFSSTVGGSTAGVGMEILGPDLLYTTPITTWRLGLYTSAGGWPTCGCYHEGRLWLGGSLVNRIDGSQPNQSWVSEISFAPTAYDGTVADDNAIDYTLNSDAKNTVQWMKADADGIIVGCEKSEYLVQATATNLPLTPTSIQAHRVTKQGSSVLSTAEPVQTEHTAVFIQRFGRKLIEYFKDVFSGKLTAPNIAISAQHLTAPTLARIAYQQNVSPIIWAQTATGGLIGCTYKRDSLFSSQGPTYSGWHRHTLGSGRLISSICVGPSPDGTVDTLAIVDVPPSGSEPYNVQFMNRQFLETDTIVEASFVDSGITPTVTVSGSNLVLTGLWPLNGKLVTAWIEGLDCGDYTVANGTITVPEVTANPLLTSAFVTANTPLTAVVGFTYTSDGQIVTPQDPAEAGTRNGPAFGKTGRIEKAALKLVNTQGISMGSGFDHLHPLVLMSTGGSVVLPANSLYSGTVRDSVDTEYVYGPKIAWRISRPYPATVAVAGGFLNTQDL